MTEEPIRAALYERVSTAAQAEEGYSLDGQLHELRERMGAEGRRVVAEVSDPGEKRWMYERPGLERVKELAAAGEIDEVWAWAWDRFGESPWPEVLSLELAEHGVKLRSLDDGGEGEDAALLRALRGQLARREQPERVEKSRMGKRAKARKGHVLGAGRGPRYGFRAVRSEKGRVVGYEVNEETMAVVRTVFAMLDAGESIHAVQVALEREGIEAPRGGPRWSRDTIRNMVREDSYLPHSPDELAALVAEGLMSGEVHRGLDPARPCGVDYYGRTRSRRISHRTKKRRVQPAPRSEWVAVPVDLSGSGLERGKVLRARAAIADNRVPSKVGDYEFELSRGFLFCAHCGRAMTSYARRFPEKGRNHYYYRCDERHKSRGMIPAECPNRKSHRAEVLEYLAASTFERSASRGTLLEMFDRAVEEQPGAGRGGPPRSAGRPWRASWRNWRWNARATCARTPAGCSPTRTWTPCSPRWTNSARGSPPSSAPSRTKRNGRGGSRPPGSPSLGRTGPTTRTPSGPTSGSPSRRRRRRSAARTGGTAPASRWTGRASLPCAWTCRWTAGCWV